MYHSDSSIVIEKNIHTQYLDNKFPVVSQSSLYPSHIRNSRQMFSSCYKGILTIAFMFVEMCCL